MTNERSSAFPPGLVIYQVYPRSFKDSDGDGIGDIPGIISKLDYLEELGVNAVWICPVYPSPQVDFGYDVSDYTDVDPQYGTLADLEDLIKQAHARGIKIVLDMVLNHTSDQHPWFKQAKLSKDNPKRDWYIWKRPRAGKRPPNNWLSVFGGSAWEYDDHTGEYYMHSFFKQQPDLNWENPQVRQAIKEVMRFWLEKGVDGFRMDAVYSYGKDERFRDDPPDPDYDSRQESPYDSLLHIHSTDETSVFAYLSELAAFLKGYPGAFMVTEAYPHEPFNISSYLEFYKQVDPLIAAPFNFMSMFLPWQATHYRRLYGAFQAAMQPDYTPVYVYGNHDRPRLASRIGIDALPAAAMLQLTLPGAAVIYYGEELGMSNAIIATQDTHDQLELNVPGRGLGRDIARSPMLWDESKNNGFSSGTPWLLAQSVNATPVKQALSQPHSLLNLYRHLLKLRRKSPVLLNGSYQPLETDRAELFGFVREYDGTRWAVIINFDTDRSMPLHISARTILSTHPENTTSGVLSPGEGRIIELV